MATIEECAIGKRVRTRFQIGEGRDVLPAESEGVITDVYDIPNFQVCDIDFSGDSWQLDLHEFDVIEAA